MRITNATIQERRAEVARRFGPDACIADVARAFGVTYRVARLDLIAIGRPVGKPGRKKGYRNPGSVERSAAILRAVQADPSRPLASFGQEFGLSVGSIRRIIKAAGFVTKPVARRYSKQREASEAKRKARLEAKIQKAASVLALRARGFTYRGIGAELGMHATAAFYWNLVGAALGITVPAPAGAALRVVA